jgi:hypothetical protein
MRVCGMNLWPGLRMMGFPKEIIIKSNSAV